MNSVKQASREREKFKNLLKRNTNIISLNKDKNKHKIIFENKNIIINDITKNYGTNINNIFPHIKKLATINKLNKDTFDNSRYKYERINTETNKEKKLGSIKKLNKLNSETKNNIKNNNNMSNTKSLKRKPSKNIIKSSYNQKITGSKEMKKFNKNSFIQNKTKRIGYGGDSYEFNFTFNNYNSTFTYNDLNGNIIKENNKKTDKIVIEGLSNENILKKFKSINSPSVRNNILGGLKNILNKNKNDDKKITTVKQIQKIDTKKRFNRIDKNSYATKIQKVFRGYYYRKNHKIKDKYSTINANSSFGIYKRKKIINSRRSLNYNTNNTENNLTSSSLLKEKNRINYNDTKKVENNNESENKIQEIIIDKTKIFNVLNPTSKGNNIREIKINNNYSIKSHLNKKLLLLRCFSNWKNMAMKYIIIQKLIEYIRTKKITRNLNNLDFNIKYQSAKRGNGNIIYGRGRY